MTARRVLLLAILSTSTGLSFWTSSSWGFPDTQAGFFLGWKHSMAGPADDIKAGVKGLGLSSPLAQISDRLGKVGAGVQDVYAGAKKRAGEVFGRAAGAVGMSTAPDPRPRGKLIGDIKLPPMKRKTSGGAYGKGRSMSKGR